MTYGADVYKAFFNMETVEHFARIALVAELLGGRQGAARRPKSTNCSIRAPATASSPATALSPIVP